MEEDPQPIEALTGRRRLLQGAAFVLFFTAAISFANHFSLFGSERADQSAGSSTDLRPFPARSFYYARCYSLSYYLNGSVYYEPTKTHMLEVGIRPRTEGEYACLPRFVMLRPASTDEVITRYLLPVLKADDRIQLPTTYEPSSHADETSNQDSETNKEIHSPLIEANAHLDSYLPAWPVMVRPGFKGNIDMSDENLSANGAYSRAKSILGGSTRFIVWLRNPIDLVWNLYHKLVRAKSPSVEFDDWVSIAMEKLPKETCGPQDITMRPPWIDALPQDVRDVLVAPMYDIHMYQWLREYPRDNFMFVQEDSVEENYSSFEKRMGSFLHGAATIMPFKPPGILPSGHVPHRPFFMANQMLISQKKPIPHMSVSTRSQLAQLFRPHIERLKQVMGSLSSEEWSDWILD